VCTQAYFFRNSNQMPIAMNAINTQTNGSSNSSNISEPYACLRSSNVGHSDNSARALTRPSCNYQLQRFLAQRKLHKRELRLPRQRLKRRDYDLGTRERSVGDERKKSTI
jgi:hypothetical protein